MSDRNEFQSKREDLSGETTVVPDDDADDALHPVTSVTRRRKQTRVAFWSGIGTFVAEVGGGLYLLVAKGAWPDGIWLAMMASGSLALAAAGLYQWAFNKRLDRGVGFRMRRRRF